MFAQECLHYTGNPEDRLGLLRLRGAYTRWCDKKTEDRPRLNHISLKIVWEKYAGRRRPASKSDTSRVAVGWVLKPEA